MNDERAVEFGPSPKPSSDGPYQGEEHTSSHYRRELKSSEVIIQSSIGNVNSASVASLSSNESGESYVVEREEMVVLSNEARALEEALSRLSILFQNGMKFDEVTKVEAFDCLGEVLKILRHMMTDYPALQSDELITTGGKLIKKVKNIDWEKGSSNEHQDIQDVQDILELIASTLSTRVTEFLIGDLENLSSISPSLRKLKSINSLQTGNLVSNKIIMISLI